MRDVLELRILIFEIGRTTSVSTFFVLLDIYFDEIRRLLHPSKTYIFLYIYIDFWIDAAFTHVHWFLQIGKFFSLLSKNRSNYLIYKNSQISIYIYAICHQISSRDVVSKSPHRESFAHDMTWRGVGLDYASIVSFVKVNYRSHKSKSDIFIIFYENCYLKIPIVKKSKTNSENCDNHL